MSQEKSLDERSCVNDLEESNEVQRKVIVEHDGRAAWLVSFGGFCGMFAVYGVNYSQGVFLNYYNKHVYVGQMNQLSWISSLCIALYFILGPVNDWVVRRLGYRTMLAIATIVCPLGLMLASITHQIWQLYLTQGALFGIGASFVWFPCISAPQQWFSKRRGLGVGITMCGSGIGGLVLSNICNAALQTLGYRWALRIMGFIVFFFLILATLFVKQPPTQVQPAHSWRRMGRHQAALLRNPQFNLMLLVGLITTFGYLVPSFLLPSYADFLGLDSWTGANLSAIMSAINAVSKLVNGYASDRLGRINVFGLCTFLSGIMCLAIWTNAHTLATVWVFAVLYGFFGGGYLTLFPASLPQVISGTRIADMDDQDPALLIPAANGLLYFTNLFGYLVGTPIASALINRTSPPTYLYAMLWAGLLMSVSGIIVFVLRVIRVGWNPLVKD